MTAEEIKRIVDNEHAEQLTARLCRHWEVATARLEGLVQDLADDMDTCVEAEIYAAMMRMQSAIMALMELNKMPCAYLFSEYLDRVAQTVSNSSMRQSVMTLMERLFSDQPKEQKTSFFDLVDQSMAQHFALPTEKQEAIRQKVSPIQYFFSICAQHLQPDDLMMMASLIQNLSSESGENDQKETTDYLKNLRQSMEDLAGKMGESQQMMLVWLLILMLLPGSMVSLMQQSRSNGKGMTQLFNKVLARVRKSDKWWDYWKEYRETLRVVSDDISWKDIMTAERSKERAALGQVPGGLFAKYTTDTEAFEETFMETGLSDDALRHFIFHLASLYEIAREIDPTTKYGDEQLVNNDLQRVGEAVMNAARKLYNLVSPEWIPHYDAMWQELIGNETIFALLKVTRKSQHNNLFTARFFCHLVGEMKKRSVFGGHSDMDLAKKIAETQFADTFRKNIQEGMSNEDSFTKSEFDTIYLKYNNLAHPKQ